MAWWSPLREGVGRWLGTGSAPPAPTVAPGAATGPATYSTGATSSQARPEPAWPDLPAVQRSLVEPLRPVAPLNTFAHGLASHRDPSFLRPLGHRVDAGLGGLVDGLTKLAPGRPVAYAPADDLTVRPVAPPDRRAPTGASVQRRVVTPADADLDVVPARPRTDVTEALVQRTSATVLDGTGAVGAPLAAPAPAVTLVADPAPVVPVLDLPPLADLPLAVSPAHRIRLPEPAAQRSTDAAGPGPDAGGSVDTSSVLEAFAPVQPPAAYKAPEAQAAPDHVDVIAPAGEAEPPALVAGDVDRAPAVQRAEAPAVVGLHRRSLSVADPRPPSVQPAPALPLPVLELPVAPLMGPGPTSAPSAARASVPPSTTEVPAPAVRSESAAEAPLSGFAAAISRLATSDARPSVEPASETAPNGSGPGSTPVGAPVGSPVGATVGSLVGSSAAPGVPASYDHPVAPALQRLVGHELVSPLGSALVPPSPADDRTVWGDLPRLTTLAPSQSPQVQRAPVQGVDAVLLGGRPALVQRRVLESGWSAPTPRAQPLRYPPVATGGTDRPEHGQVTLQQQRATTPPPTSSSAPTRAAAGPNSDGAGFGPAVRALVGPASTASVPVVAPSSAAGPASAVAPPAAAGAVHTPPPAAISYASPGSYADIAPVGEPADEVDLVPYADVVPLDPADPVLQRLSAAPRHPPGAAVGAGPRSVSRPGVSFASMFSGAPAAGGAGWTSVQLTSAGTSSAAAEQAPVETGPAPAPTAAPAAASPVPAAAAGLSAAGPAPNDLDEMARRLFEPLSARLRAELSLDRERAGMVADVRP